MLTENTVTKLQEMHLTIMAKAFKEQLSDPEMNALSFEDRMGLIVEQPSEQTHKKCRLFRSGSVCGKYRISCRP